MPYFKWYYYYLSLLRILDPPKKCYEIYTLIYWCLFVCSFYSTHFSMQSKGGSCEGEEIPCGVSPNCKGVRFACPPYTWGETPQTDPQSAWLSMSHSLGIEPSNFQLGERRSNHYTIPTLTDVNAFCRISKVSKCVNGNYLSSVLLTSKGLFINWVIFCCLNFESIQVNTTLYEILSQPG